jgi:hypothetical protein
VVLALVGVITVVASLVGGFRAVFAHEQDGGRARVYGAFTAEDCGRPGCGPGDHTVRFDLEGDNTDEVADERLYHRVVSDGPFVTDVKVQSDTHEVTQVRERGGWRVVAHAAAGNAVELVLSFVVGLFLLFVGLGMWPSEGARPADSEAR